MKLQIQIYVKYLIWQFQVSQQQIVTVRMNNRFEAYAYNFNPRDGPKDNKLKYLMKTGVMRRRDIPIGMFTELHQYKTACRSPYLRYHECLEFNKFDRAICRQFQNEVITCEHSQGLHPKTQDVIARLQKGLQNSKKRRQQINAKLKQQHESRKFTKSEQLSFKKQQQVLESIPNVVDVIETVNANDED